MKLNFKRNIILLCMSMLLPKGLWAQSLSPPTAVKASQKNTNCIKITCKHTHFTAATSLRLYRSRTPNFATAELIRSNHYETTFLDKDARLETDVFYYYWILEENPKTGELSAPSEMGTGKKCSSDQASVLLSPPALQASKDKPSIQLTWANSMLLEEGENSQYVFEIYRSEFFDVKAAIRIATTQDTVFNDEAPSLLPNTTYYYRIRVMNEATGEASEFSRPVKGLKKASSEPSSAPMSVDLSVPMDNNDLKFGSVAAGSKKALVIGISNYTQLSPLPMALNDARAIANLLRANGWDVMGREDLQTKASFEKVLKDFVLKASLKSQDTLLIYYSGHGVNYNNRNYLVPKSANIRLTSLIPEECFELDALMKPLLGKCEVQVVLFDACYIYNMLGEQECLQLNTSTIQTWNAKKLLLAASVPTPYSNSSLFSPFTGALYDVLKKEPCIPFEDALQKIQRVSTVHSSNGSKVSVKKCD